MKDAAAGTTVKFARAENYQQGTPTYYGQIGWQGFGSGQFYLPTGVATDAKGDVWVADTTTDRVQEFNPQGTYVRQFGSEGSGNGQLREPHGAVVDTKGNVWVADTANNRIEEFSETGSYVRQTGSEGTGNGQFKAPMGIAVDAKGNVWVTDSKNNRIEEFSETGTFVRQAGPAAGAHELSEPLGVTADTKGNVWVADSKNHRVAEFSETGGYLKEYGSLGTGNGQFETPVGISADALGDVWVSDSGENRVQELGSKGEYLTQFGANGSEGGQFRKPYFLAVAGNGSMVVADSENYRVQRWGHATWLPTVSEGVVASATVTYAYATVLVEGKPVVEPTEALAPHPTELSCSPLKQGCRALTFNYATSTTATGEGSSEWGDYKGRLTRVYFNGWDTVSKTMKATEITHYLYDAKGQLRAEWDPRITPSLKTTYGYDVEGHVTAVSPPGQQPWLLEYGTIAADGTTGRLISATRTSATTGLGSGAMPANTEAPKLSASPVQGVSLSVSTGVWSNSPLSYGFQWERCNASGVECAAIAGATNQTYTPVAADDEHKLVAEVRALNSGGTGHATSTSSAIVTQIPAYSSQFGSEGATNGKFKAPKGVALDSKGDVWVVDTFNHRVQEFSAAGAYLSQFGSEGTGNGQFKEPKGIGIDSKNNIWVSDQANNCVQQFNEKGEFIRKVGTEGTGNGQFLYPQGVSVDTKNNVWIADTYNNRIQELNEKGEVLRKFGEWGSGNGQLKEPNGVAVDASGDVWAADTKNSRVEEFKEKGEFVRQFGAVGTGAGQFKEPKGIAVDSADNVWVADSVNSRLQKFSASGEYLGQLGSEGTGNGQFKETRGVVLNSSGTMWVTDVLNNRIEKFVVPSGEGAPAPPNPGSSALTTIEYQVPLSGSGLQTLTKSEVEKWAQKDYPTEGTAVFPPDEPQGWPAGSYTRATISYFDAQGRTVNTTSPSGAVSTSEYNEMNDVVRTLSPDNRAAALKEGAKSAEVAKLLDSQSVYNEEGDELLETAGPEHKIKLSSGSEVQARHRVKFYYDEGAPEGGPYRLVTKSTDAALVAGKEEDVRTTVTSYSGQNNLGWRLRKPTSVVTDPSGLKLTTATVYDPITGSVLEARKGASAASAAFVNQFGSERGGKSKFNWPVGMTIDSLGNIWVADTYNNRVQEFSSSGAFIREFGSWGTGNGQMEYPKAIVVDSKGHVWIVDPGVERVEEFSETGTYIEAFGKEGTENGQFKSPEGIAVDSKGNVWVVDKTRNIVQEFSETGTYMAQFGAEGTGNGQFREPRRIRVDSKGNICVSDGLNCRVQEFNEKREFVRTFGSCGSGNGQFNDPQGIAFDSSGHVWIADENNNRIQEFSETGSYMFQFGSKGSGNGQLLEEEDLAFDSEGHVWVLDSGNARVQEFSSGGSYLSQFGAKGSPEGALYDPKGVALDGSGHLWVADTNNDRIMEFSESGEYLSRFGSEGTGPGQFKAPRAIAIDSKGNIWVLDQTNDRVSEFNNKGEVLLEFGSVGTENGKFKEPQGIAIDTKGNVWIGDTVNNRVQEFNEKGEFIRKFGELGSGHGQFNEPKGITLDAKDDVWVADSQNNRIEEVAEKGEYITQFGAWGSGEGQLKWPLGVTLDANGRLWVVDTANNRIQEFNQKGAVLGSFGSAGTGNGQMGEPRAITLDTHGNAWVTDTNNNRIERWTVSTPVDTQTIYYTREATVFASECGGHVEWEGMPCQTRPAAQPSTSSAPPVSAMTVNAYNIWGEPETSTEKFGEAVGATTRTKKLTYDEAGRVLSTEETTTSAVNRALPKVTDTYNETTGQLVTQSATEGETTRTITSVYDTLGRLTKYTDADENTTTYEYETSGDGRLTSVSDPKGTQTYSYDPTTGALTKLLDSAAGTFTAGYDVEGNMETETYPNGMTATYTRDHAGETTAVSYVKNTHCAGTCPETWFSETTAPSIHGETLSRSSSLSAESYTYDNAGRLLETGEEPVGKGCTARIYAYDEESNRTSLTTREPGSGGKCATEGGTTETHTYDTADRLTDTGITYDPLANTTELPAVDAGGHVLTTSYYVDGQVEKQIQNGQTNTYTVDPAGRVRKTIGEGTSNMTAISHYAGNGEALTWKDEGSGKYTRLIPGIDGSLCATQANGGTPILQLHDLEGDIVATAALSETETKLATTYNSTEFGVPVNGAPPTKYSWLGAAGVSSELSSGTLISGTVAYVPQLGRVLQTEAVTPPGAVADGLGSGPAYVPQVSAWQVASGNETAKRHAEEGAAEEEAVKREAEEKILQQCREEGGCGAEGGGDPCTTTFNQGHVTLLGKQILSAWATISWCYNGREVFNAKVKNRGEHVHNHWWTGFECGFDKWVDRAEFKGAAYWIERSAKFWCKAEFGFPDFEGGAPVEWHETIKLYFELYPNGESTIW